MLPIGLTIRTFIGMYLPTRSLEQALFGAIGALVVGIVISFLIQNKKDVYIASPYKTTSKIINSFKKSVR